MRKYSVFIIAFLFFIGIIFLFIPRNQFPFVSPVSTKELINLLPNTWNPPAVNLDSIFSEDHTWISTIPSDKKWTLVATGDIIPARSVNQQTVKRNDFTWGWKNIMPILQSGDMTLINLESPLVPNCPVTVEGMIFCGDQRHIVGLKAGKVTIANFANNHMGNYGVKGIEETKKILEDNDIKISGLGNPSIVEIQGIKVAFLGFDDIGPNVPPVAPADDEAMKKAIIEAKNASDIVIVSMSWGVEYTDKPSDRQKELAHFIIDNGADLIIGNHPHWIQPVEFYKGKVIMYAHGNTIFDQMWSEKTKEGVIGKYTFYGKDLVDIEFIPTYIKDYGQPEVLTSGKKDTILQSLKKISFEIQ
jgi:poly-gamma-glutamate synthesis protein (capsule biosynthesis protein)